MSSLESPIPLSDIEAVLAWVDTFKLSRNTKKINRDFSDAVLLAEIMSVHYPKLVEMHNYPPRNSLALKLNNWMTLNRKVLRKLKLGLCCSTMEQLANSAPGVIERVLIMVREKIHRDEELHKSMKESDQNVSSGGSYYEALGDEDQVLVVPVKTRVSGVLETINQKVVSHDAFVTMKEELKDAKETIDVLKQKVEHLDNLMKLKDERISELINQLERKAIRRKEVETIQNSLAVPFDSLPSPVPKIEDSVEPIKVPSFHNTIIEIPKVSSVQSSVNSMFKIIRDETEAKNPEEPKPLTPKESKIPIAKPIEEPKVTFIKVEEKAPSKLNDVPKDASKRSTDTLVDENERKSVTSLKDRTPSVKDVTERKSAISLKDKIPSVKDIPKNDEAKSTISLKDKLPSFKDIPKNDEEKSAISLKDKLPPVKDIPKNDEVKPGAKKSSVLVAEDIVTDVCRVKSDLFKEIEFMSARTSDGYQDSEDFRDVPFQPFEVTIEDTIYKEIREIENTVTKKSSKPDIGILNNDPM